MWLTAVPYLLLLLCSKAGRRPGTVDGIDPYIAVWLGAVLVLLLTLNFILQCGWLPSWDCCYWHQMTSYSLGYYRYTENRQKN